MVKRAGGALLLSLKADPHSPRPVSSQLAAGLRDIILSGGLAAGDRLPASRTLARDLGYSRTTIIDVYSRLTAEGLLESRTGAGTYVAQALAAERPQPAAPAPDRASEEPVRRPRLSRALTLASEHFQARLPHEPRAFTTAMPAFDAFPLALWSRMVAKHWRARRDRVMGYADPQGSARLRQAIAAHLRANRGIACEPEQVFVTSGAQQAFHLIGSLFLDPGDRVWFENPGAIGARNAFMAAGADLLPLPVDGEGLVVAEGLKRAPWFRLAFVTPSHQQPLGPSMSLERRFALLQAAEAADALIVEDDYDGEFVYSGHPLPTLKSVDRTGRVLYVGTFSKTLFPALRLGYLVAPPALVEVFREVLGAFVQGAPQDSQEVLADFMEEGHFAVHIRRMRRTYAERFQVLAEAGRRRLGGLLEIVPTESGLHTTGLLKIPLAERAVARAAAARGITVAPIERFCLEPVEPRGFVLGFSGVPPAELEAGVETLAAVLEEQLGAGRKARARA